MASEDSKHSFSDRSSWASNLPHLWVIEVLARSNQADISLLLDLVKTTPEILEDIGENAREWVSLRILESFNDQGVRSNSVTLTPAKRIGFDLSEQCEDVLRRILLETSMSDLKTAGLEMLKWDFQTFIVHKRSSLAKCSLQKLKDAILIGSHPLSASLKEQSGLLGGNQSEDKVPVEESNNNDITTKPKGSNTNTQIGAANNQLSYSTLANCSNPFYKNIPDQNLLLSKRKRSSTVESMQLTDTSMVILQHSEGELCTLGKKSHVVGPGENGSFGVDNNEHTSLKSHAGPDEVLPCQEQDYNFVPDDTSKEDVGGLHLLANALSIVLQNSEGDISGSGEKINVRVMEKIDWRELNRSIKCNESGKLLICSSNSCSSVIHKSCLGSDAIFDKMEEFHCPFCAYSLALSKFLEVKAKVSLARKDLATFLSRGSRKRSKGNFCMSRGMVQNHLEQDEDSHKSELQTGGCNVNKHHNRKKIECEEVGPSALSFGDNPPRKDVASTNELTRDLNKDKQGEGMRQESQSPGVHGQNQVAAMADHISQVENTMRRSKKQVLCPPDSDTERTSSPINEYTDEDELSGEGSEDADVSKYFISFRKHKRQSSNPGTPQLRRKRVPWTIKEELTMKDAMQRFCGDENKSIPWKKILDYGENVFHESRTTVDLKDKWRNIKKLLEKLYPSNEDERVT